MRKGDRRSIRAPLRYKVRMDLPLVPPVQPMLARLMRHLPPDALYEPKWDGFRCLAFRDGGALDLRSRNDRPLARYFPELVEAFLDMPQQRVVLDGELLAAGSEGFDFGTLLARLHPAASRVEHLSRETPARFVAFDLLAERRRSLLGLPFAERRRRLERIFTDSRGRILLTPITADRERAQQWLTGGNGVDGVVAKDPALPYRPGERTMVKVKEERTADCVIAGFRLFEDRPLPSSLLLGIYDERGELRHVGVASSFAEEVRFHLFEELAPRAVALAGHPWEHGFLVEGSAMGRMKGAAAKWIPEMGLDWIPVAAELVCEVAYDHIDRDRFRHPARFRRFRPDRDPRSCTFQQFGAAIAPTASAFR
jgi:ATP-dependent DNA ligase